MEGSGRLAPSRAEERAEQRAIDALLRAFVAGRVGDSLRSDRRELRAAWRRGRAFAEQMAAGLRPIDTVRRKTGAASAPAKP